METEKLLQAVKILEETIREVDRVFGKDKIKLVKIEEDEGLIEIELFIDMPFNINMWLEKWAEVSATVNAPAPFTILIDFYREDEDD